MRILAFLLGMSIALFAAAEGDVLKQARELYAAKRVAEAFAALDSHIAENPNDVDVILVRALMSSWEGRFDEGREGFEKVLALTPDYKDARIGYINLERWAGNHDRSVSLAIEAVGFRPKDKEFKDALRKSIAAQAAARRTGEVARADAKWEFGVDFSQIRFSDKRPNWTERTYIVSKNTAHGWLNARLQQASFGGTRSNLYEFEMYPKLGAGRYGLISGGFSPDANLYAHRRFAGEVFQNLPHGFEGSLGFRHFRFDRGVNLVTGSLAKYFGEWWLSGRTFLTPGEFGTSKSLQLSARRYFRDADHFIGFRAGLGATPFEVRSVNETGVLDSESIGFEALWKYPNKMRMRLNAGAGRQRRAYTQQYLWLYTFGATFYYGL